VASSEALVALFRELAELASLDEGSPNSFRARAYENARDAIGSYRGDLSALTAKELTGIPGIGSSTAKKIREYFETGTIAKLEELRRKYPPDFVELGKIPGLGPKTLLRLRSELGIQNLNDLKVALDTKKISDLKGLGAKSEEKIGQAIYRMVITWKEYRVPFHVALTVAR
jgi:DNA polymerase (family 10)